MLAPLAVNVVPAGGLSVTVNGVDRASGLPGAAGLVVASLDGQRGGGLAATIQPPSIWVETPSVPVTV